MITHTMRVANGTGMSVNSNCKISNEKIYLRFYKKKKKREKIVYNLIENLIILIGTEYKVCVNILVIQVLYTY